MGLALEHLEAGPGDLRAAALAESRSQSGLAPPASTRVGAAILPSEGGGSPTPITAASYASVGASPSPSAQYGDCRIPAMAGSGTPTIRMNSSSAPPRSSAASSAASRSLYVAVCR